MLCWCAALMLVTVLAETWRWKTGMVRSSALLLLGLGMLLLLMRGRIICVLLLAVVASMRVMARVVHTVVFYPIVACQRVSDAWVPPEQTALDGRRAVRRENWDRVSPVGLCRERLRRGINRR